MFGRLFGKSRKASPASAKKELPIDQATIGLCFDFQRGIDYSSEYLTDVGLDCILQTLRTHGLRATFNCSAKLCESAPDHLSKIAEAGHEISALGYADESPRDLSEDAIKQLVYTCRSEFAKRGLHPIGFRSPHSHWDNRLCRELARQKFIYNAEHDHAKCPYVLVPGSPPLVRIPVRTDDRGLRRSEDTYYATVSKHLRAVRKAIQHRYFVTICFHPWILAEDMERMEHWQSWLNFGVKAGAKMIPLQDALPNEYRLNEIETNRS